VEYVFLLTKSARYFWDAEAVKRSQSNGTLDRFGGDNAPRRQAVKQGGTQRQCDTWVDPVGVLAGGRNMRNSDLFYDSLEMQPEPIALPDIERYQHLNPRGAEGARAKRRAFETGASYPLPGNEPLGLICDADGSPLALDVNPAAFSSAHFATFPPRLVEPLIRAGTSERGCCAQCGAPWARQVERKHYGDFYDRRPDHKRSMETGHTRNGAGGQKEWDEYVAPVTTGWSPGCDHEAACVPCTVLDPFAGAGTTLLVADRLQRDAIGIELNPDYVSMGDSRVVDDAPLLAWLAEAAE
jgi:hypothetical protein